MDWNQAMEKLLPVFVTHGLRIAGALVGLWVVIKLAGQVQRRITTALQAREFDITLSIFFGSLARWLLLAVAILAILGVFGFETASFAAIIGAAGLAFGLAFQGTLSNFSAGVMLLVFRPFKVGDRIEVDGVKGRVSEIGLFTTAVDTTDRRRQILPNSVVNTSVIQNQSYHETRRVDVTAYFAAECDPGVVRTTLADIGRRFNRVEIRPEADIVVKRLHPWGSEWELRIYVPMLEHNDVLYAAHEAILLAMAEKGLRPPEAHFTGGGRLTS